MKRWRLEIRDVVKEFSGDRGLKTRALDGISFDITAGEWIVIVGPNGSGKSTLLNLLAGRLRPDDGTVVLEDDGKKTDWYALSLAERARYFAYLQQEPRAGSFVNLTVVENLRIAGLYSSRPWRGAVSRAFEMDMEARLLSIGLSGKLHSRLSELSQGQRQMVALQMALLRRPHLLLADEHTASLDQTNARHCMDMTAQLWEQGGASVLMITHDPVIAQEYGSRLLAFQSGRILVDMEAQQKSALGLDRMLALCGMGVVQDGTPQAS